LFKICQGKNLATTKYVTLTFEVRADTIIWLTFVVLSAAFLEEEGGNILVAG